MEVSCIPLSESEVFTWKDICKSDPRNLTEAMRASIQDQEVFGKSTRMSSTSCWNLWVLSPKESLLQNMRNLENIREIDRTC